MTLWERLDGPVLQWVHERAGEQSQWQLDRHEVFEEIPGGLTGTEVDEALRRLEHEELVKGNRGEAGWLFRLVSPQARPGRSSRSGGMAGGA